jgi:hypothetical protein
MDDARELHMSYTVRIEWYSLAPHCVGQPTGERKEFKHRTLKAARRRLGSIISGKQRKAQYCTPSLDGGAGCRLFIVTPTGEEITANEATRRIRGEE